MASGKENIQVEVLALAHTARMPDGTDLVQRIVAILQAHGTELRRAGIRHLSLFGSFARGDADAASDVDLAVEFDPAARMDLFRLTALERRICRNPWPARGPVAGTGPAATPAGQRRSGPPACLLRV